MNDARTPIAHERVDERPSETRRATQGPHAGVRVYRLPPPRLPVRETARWWR